MSNRDPFIPGNMYHIYNRGHDKLDIFYNPGNYKRFQNLLFFSNLKENIRLDRLTFEMWEGLTFPHKEGNLGVDMSKKWVEILAYCLMPNHFHILIKEIEGGGISKFMQKLSTAYTMYFNESNKRQGSLFQGTYKSKLIDNDDYFKYCLSYIHLNPLKIVDSNWKTSKNMDLRISADFLKHYEHSSLLDYLNIPRKDLRIINKELLSSYFDGGADAIIRKLVIDWLSNLK